MSKDSDNRILPRLEGTSGNLFVRKPDSVFRIWNRPRLRLLEALRRGVRNASTIAALMNRVPRLEDDVLLRVFVAWYCSEPRLSFSRTVVISDSTAHISKSKERAGLRLGLFCSF
jgi:hypothetical protein